MCCLGNNTHTNKTHKSLRNGSADIVVGFVWCEFKGLTTTEKRNKEHIKVKAKETAKQSSSKEGFFKKKKKPK